MTLPGLIVVPRNAERRNGRNASHRVSSQRYASQRYDFLSRQWKRWRLIHFSARALH
jgi:hypothetical protein